MTRKSRARPWYRKKRAPNQGRKREPRKGVSVHSKSPKRKKVTGHRWKPAEAKNLLNEEISKPQHKMKRKKPWSSQLKGFAKWLIILKLTATLVNEALQFFR